ncbi:MAG: aquaporin [Ruminococcus sp.]|nr:aquaporin [Ruminococcus sp.]
MKRYAAECIGTCVLVLIGCGAAMSGLGTLTIALAFGLSIVAMAYSIGNISGCHVNPAVSFAVYMNGGLNTREFLGYVVSQCAGSFIGTLLLRLIFKLSDIKDYTAPEDKDWGMGANTLAGVNDSIIAGFIVEIVLTFIFVIAILGVTSKKANHGSFGGLVIGLTLTLVHILGIGLTGTSVNPARSLFPAIFALGDALIQVWIFIIAPFIGAGLAALAYKWLDADNK